MINYLTKHLIVRYIISGGTSAFINLCVFYALYHLFHTYYIFASIIAFIIAFFVSITLHKLWTFHDHSLDNIHMQVGKYLLTSLFGLCINTLVLYVCVEYVHLYALLGQIIAGIVTACCTFFLSRDYVFNQPPIV